MIINIDSKKMPNLALKKIEKYYTRKGYRVIWDLPLMAGEVERIFVSCIYDWNRNKAKEWERYPHAEIGGSGYDLKKTLPPEIEREKLRINIGFTTRGCIRKCPFCIVPEKEGTIRVVGDIYDIWDGKSDKITLLDNNILAVPEHFFKITEQIKKENLKVDFNQGLDCRLLNEDIAKRLAEIRHVEYRFAFDWVNLEPQVKRTVKLLRKYGINRARWYVLVGFNTTIEEDLYRLNLLRRLGQRAYVQRYRKERKYIPIAQWANQAHIFARMTFEQFLEIRKYRKWKEEFAGVLGGWR